MNTEHAAEWGAFHGLPGCAGAQSGMAEAGRSQVALSLHDISVPVTGVHGRACKANSNPINKNVSE